MKNKLLISFILFIIILSFFTCSFASSVFPFEFYDGQSYDIEIDTSIISRPYFILFAHNTGNSTAVSFFVCDEELMFYQDTGSDFRSLFIKDRRDGYSSLNASDYNLKYFLLSSNKNYSISSLLSYISTKTFDNLNVPSTCGYLESMPLDENYIIYSNYDVYTSSGKLLFQGAPVNQVKIPAIQQVEEIPQVMEQVLQILIPIGLIVFSVGLVIYLTRLVISRVQ